MKAARPDLPHGPGASGRRGGGGGARGNRGGGGAAEATAALPGLSDAIPRVRFDDLSTLKLKHILSYFVKFAIQINSKIKAVWTSLPRDEIMQK